MARYVAHVLSSPPDDAATTPVPAVFLPQNWTRIAGALPTALGVLGVVGLVLVALSGFSGTQEPAGATYPAWLMLAAAVALAGGLLAVRARRAPWSPAWSLVEMLERPDGVVLFAGRLGARHEGVAVHRGESVEIAATHVRRGRHQYVVTAPSGELRFAADGLAGWLTMQPLEEAAARHGITVVTVGEAAGITRTLDT